MSKELIVAVTLLILSGCVSNPINRATSDNYAETCDIAEQNGNLKVAEEACYRALVNTDWGNLGNDLKSEKLYNLARIKRQLAKFQEAESLLNQSLEIEENKSTTMNAKIGRRLVELSVNLAALDRWQEGASAIEKVIPVAKQYSGQERQFIILVLEKYGEHFNNSGNKEKGQLFLSQSRNL